MESKFVHLHLHTEYSRLDGECRIPELLARVGELGQGAVAITDHGVMHGVYTFLEETERYNKKVQEEIALATEALQASEANSEPALAAQARLEAAQRKYVKPIVGMEAYMAPESRLSRDKNEPQWHLVLLAKNLKGYENLCHLTYFSNGEGFYKKPRIDWELLECYGEGLIVSSACLGGPIATLIRKGKYEEARSVLKRFQSLFGENFYLEFMLHPPKERDDLGTTFEKQAEVAAIQLMLARELGVDSLITNDVHFLSAEDAPLHDLILCISFEQMMSDTHRIRYTHQEYVKSAQEIEDTFMASFSQVSQAYARCYPLLRESASLQEQHAYMELGEELSQGAWQALVEEGMRNSVRIAEAVEEYSLQREAMMPNFDVPAEFANASDYLRHCVMKGAHLHWGEDLPVSYVERLEYELKVVDGMGFSSYFLIVADIQNFARKEGIPIGPGRGSAPGAAISYCLGITAVDPIKYHLLFERFLNPDRVSLPDIDLDFHDGRREEIVRYVQKKYGEDCIGGVSAFSRSMVKTSFNDAVKYLELGENEEVKKLHQLVRESSVTTFEKLLDSVPEVKAAYENGSDTVRHLLKMVCNLTGRLRSLSQHACGYIVSPGPLHNYAPVCTPPKNTVRRIGEGGDTAISMDFMVQYEGKHIESVGLIKMDFLGLKTLRVIDLTKRNLEQTRGIQLDMEKVPLDDPKVYEVFARGDTVALFQFESEGMRSYLRALQPTQFTDLIAMNALYRPGPLEHIGDFIARKHGELPIEYFFEEQASILDETYGITVFQEQVMNQSRVLAGFTAGEADSLRKAIGKKKEKEMLRLGTQFKAGCLERGHDEEKVNQLWDEWLKFAKYAFNKSHSTAYAYVAYQTGYLKAYYPCEFMAACLEVALGQNNDQRIFIQECKRMGIPFRLPDVNVSRMEYLVTREGEIYCGMMAVKGLRQSTIQAIVKERDTCGRYKDIFDFVSRIEPSVLTESEMDSLVDSGALDGFLPLGCTRLVFRQPVKGESIRGGASEETFLQQLLWYGHSMYSIKKSSFSLFQGASTQGSVNPPTWPNEPKGNREKSRMHILQKEKDLLGTYVSEHPLDLYTMELRYYCDCTLDNLKRHGKTYEGRQLRIGGIVSKLQVKTKVSEHPMYEAQISKQLVITLEDYTTDFRFYVFHVDGGVLNEIRESDAVILNVQVERGKGNGMPFMKVENAIRLSDVQRRNLLSYSLVLNPKQLTQSVLSQMRLLLSSNQGVTPLGLELQGESCGEKGLSFRSGVGVHVCDNLVDGLLDVGIFSKIQGQLIEQKRENRVLQDVVGCESSPLEEELQEVEEYAD